MFQNYKTYIFAFLIAVAAAAHYLGYINSEVYQTLLGFLTGGGLAALRAGVAKLQDK